MKRVLGLHVESVDVVQVAIISLRHDRQRPPVTRIVRPTLLHPPLDYRIAHHSYTVGVGDHHRPFEEARLLDPGRSGHLTVAVKRVPSGEHWIVEAIFAAGKNGCHSGSHRTFADLQLARPGDQGGETHLDTGNIGDGVEPPGRPVEGYAKVARSRFCLPEQHSAESDGTQEETDQLWNRGCPAMGRH